MSTTAPENEENARRVVEAINEGTMDVLDEPLAADYVDCDSALAETYHAPEGVTEFASRLLSAFPDAEWTVKDGQFVESRGQGDTTGLVRQLGVVDLPTK